MNRGQTRFFQICFAALRQIGRLFDLPGNTWSVCVFEALDIFQIRSAEDVGNRLYSGIIVTRYLAIGPQVDADSPEAVLLPGGQHRSLHISELGMSAPGAVNNLVQRIDVRLGRSNDDIGIGTLSVNNLSVFFHSDGDFTL